MSMDQPKPLATPVVAGVLYAVAMAAIAAVAAWPIYATASFAAVAIAGTAAAVALALAARLGRWRGWAIAGLGTGIVFALGVALAVPAQWGAPGAVLAAVRGVALGAVTGWKDLVTVDLPVGGYRNLLVPALVTFFVGTLLCVLAAWRRGRSAALAVIPAIVMVCFGLVFGRTATSAPVAVGPFTVHAPVELGIGAAALVVSLTWLAWRAQDERRAALRRAADASGVRVSRRRTGSDLRRAALAGGMVVVAVAAAAVAAPAVAQGRTREVLRSAAGPEVSIREALSPLSVYRSSFQDPAFDQVLFRVESTGGPLPDRVRIATLSDYDGVTFQVSDQTSGPAASSFVRVPSRRDGGQGHPEAARIEISGLRGIWLPTFGSVERLDFAGPDAAALADSFYYNAPAQAAVETAHAGLREGDAYLVSAVVAAPPRLQDIDPPGVSSAVALPDSLETWIDDQHAGTGGAALAVLVDRLRARGYLSHALELPAGGAAWAQALPGYVFQPSAAGHSLARIDALFGQLLDREAVAARAGGAASLVGAVGDDEQFSVAVALVAERLGFPARVVVGARLSGPDDGVPPCTEGVCTGANLTAWVEVQSSHGDWVPVDVTPQHSDSVETDVTRQRDPENPTDVRPEAAREVVPPDPMQQDAPPADDSTRTGLDWAVIWASLRMAGIVAGAAMLLCGPLLVIAASKSLRRRRRRRAPDAASRLVGGWEEYVDAAVDHGLPAPGSETREEIAALYATPDASILAAGADRAVFSDSVPDRSETEAFWRLVDGERKRFADARPVWRRVAAAVSLKSYTRNLSPGFSRAGTAHRTEGRARAPLGGVR